MPITNMMLMLLTSCKYLSLSESSLSQNLTILKIRKTKKFQHKQIHLIRVKLNV